MLLFLTPDEPRPSGGVKQIYRHVQILDRAGIPARVLHAQRGFRCEWFEHDAPIAYLDESPARRLRRTLGTRLPRLLPAFRLPLTPGRRIVMRDGGGTAYRLAPDDIVVLPEYLGVELASAVPELPVVVFNQNAHETFRGYGIGTSPASVVYTEPNLLGAVVVSEHSRRYLEYAFPHLRLWRVVNGVDAELFSARGARKRRQIAFMARKLPDVLEQVVTLLAVRGALDGWTLASISGAPERVVAETLRESLVYLSTSHQEGFGLPPVEAGMSGCLVVGFAGSAAAEYFEPSPCEGVADGDVLAFAQAVENLLRWCETHPEEALSRGRALSEWLAERYSLAHEAESVVAAWREITGGAALPLAGRASHAQTG